LSKDGYCCCSRCSCCSHCSRSPSSRRIPWPCTGSAGAGCGRSSACRCGNPAGQSGRIRRRPPYSRYEGSQGMARLTCPFGSPGRRRNFPGRRSCRRSGRGREKGGRRGEGARTACRQELGLGADCRPCRGPAALSPGSGGCVGSKLGARSYQERECRREAQPSGTAVICWNIAEKDYI
jgi:hypothetical protein